MNEPSPSIQKFLERESPRATTKLPSFNYKSEIDYPCECDSCGERMTALEFNMHECPAIASVDVKQFSNFEDYSAACKIATAEWKAQR